jgi:hypothetical protein
MEISIGQSFNNFTVIAAATKKKYHLFFLCKCICGETRNVRKDNLGKVKGCGCVMKPYKQRVKQQAAPQKKEVIKNKLSARQRIDNLTLNR